ncbi:acyltransferase [Hymenobacter sp. BT175]|uniref:acyltransferase family protein n=1 Tax=Hymenobacter translucens TaxID=2886507 RepID=UPI001D0E016C|nr:acyltransferase [Hymenobacter translucens]MCC2546796.1 acyltransferase [Hymenobacter translucens]
MAGIRVFFPNLNGLRFVAALLVVVHHVEQWRAMYHLPDYWSVPAVQAFGNQGVTLFFVLSGFLITYLLLAEKAETGGIDRKKFYVRRILRTWPLYYAVVLAGFFLWPHISWLVYQPHTAGIFEKYPLRLLLYLGFLPNVDRLFFPYFPFVSQTWSIGVEEQFYLFWPLFVGWLRRPLPGLLLFIGLFLLGRETCVLLLNAGPAPLQHAFYLRKLIDLLHLTRLSSMAVGGVGAALLFYRRENVLTPLRTRWVQALTLLLIAGAFAVPAVFGRWADDAFSLLFGVLILNLAQGSTSVVSLRAPGLDFLGRISYSIYMWHNVLIVVALKLVAFLPVDPAGQRHRLLVYLLAVFMTLAVSSLSYLWLEKPFLRLKSAFAPAPRPA